MTEIIVQKLALKQDELAHCAEIVSALKTEFIHKLPEDLVVEIEELFADTVITLYRLKSEGHINAVTPDLACAWFRRHYLSPPESIEVLIGTRTSASQVMRPKPGHNYGMGDPTRSAEPGEQYPSWPDEVDTIRGLGLQSEIQQEIHNLLMKEAGFSSYAYSMPIHRLINKHGEIDENELLKQLTIAKQLLERGIEVVIVMRHFETVPYYTDQIRRKLARVVVNRFIEIGVTNFVAINEPQVELDLRQVAGKWSPYNMYNALHFLGIGPERDLIKNHRRQLKREIREFYWIVKIEAAKQGRKANVLSAANLASFDGYSRVAKFVDHRAQMGLYKDGNMHYTDTLGIQTYNHIVTREQTVIGMRKFDGLQGNSLYPKLFAELLKEVYTNYGHGRSLALTELGFSLSATFNALEPNEKVDFIEEVFKEVHQMVTENRDIKMAGIWLWTYIRNFEIINRRPGGWSNEANFGIIGEPDRTEVLTDDMPVPIKFYPNNLHRLRAVLLKYRALFNPDIYHLLPPTQKEYQTHFENLVTAITDIYMTHIQALKTERFVEGNKRKKLLRLLWKQLNYLEQYASQSGDLFGMEYAQRQSWEFMAKFKRLVPDDIRREC